MYVYLMGSIAMCFGLLMLGHRVLELVGKQVIILDYQKGFCVQFATSISIMLGSYMGIPVSSTHCNVGSLIGLSIAASFQVVDEVYNSRLEPKEFDGPQDGKINKKVLIKIFAWWMVTVPLVFLGTMVFTYVIL